MDAPTTLSRTGPNTPEPAPQIVRPAPHMPKREADMTDGPITIDIGDVRLDHVSLRVPDYDDSCRWYRQVLGLQMLREWTDPDLPGLRLCHLRLGDTALELIGGGAPLAREVVTTVADHLAPAGVVHLCLTVPDLDRASEALSAHGVVPMAGPLYVDALDITLLLIQDNAGNVLEISQRGRASPAPAAGDDVRHPRPGEAR